MLLFMRLLAGCQDVERTTAPVSSTTVKTSDWSSDSIQAKGLISVESAYELLNDTTAVFIEVSKKASYEAGHIENAIHVWRPDYSSKPNNEYGGMRASRLEMETFLSEKGIQPNDLIVLYDAKGNCEALRLAWLLNLYGHTQNLVINGGKVAWKKAGLELSREASPTLPSPTAYQFVNALDTNSLATFEEVLKAIENPNILLVDTREPEEFFGQPFKKEGKVYSWKKGASTYGCIPTALHLNWSNAVDLKDDHRFKSLKDLKYNVEQAGLTPDKEIIVYCHSGVRSAHTYYVLKEILGYPNVKNYDGSWVEWSYLYQQNPAIPIEQHTIKQAHETQLKQLQKQIIQ